jgi:predicted DNA-binding transcriptional regulator AlpA
MSIRIYRTPAAANYVGHAPSTLEKWRVTGQGPRFVKIGTRSVGYLEQDLDEFVEAGRRANTSDTAKSATLAAAMVPKPRRGRPKRGSAAPALQPECPTNAKPRPRSGARQRATVANTVGVSLK